MRVRAYSSTLIIVAIFFAGCAGVSSKKIAKMSDAQMNYLSCYELTRALRDTGSEKIRRNLLSRPGITEEDMYSIQNGSIRIGMSEYAMLCSIGRPPNDINETVGSWGVHKQYVFKTGRYSALYVYTEKGKVTSWQN